MTITFPISTPDDADLTAGTPAAIFRNVLALVVHGDNGDSWERGMRAFAEGMINCVNATRITNQWHLIDRAVHIGLTAAAEGRGDAEAAVQAAFAHYEQVAANIVGEPVEGLDLGHVVVASTPASAPTTHVPAAKVTEPKVTTAKSAETPGAVAKFTAAVRKHLGPKQS